MEIGKIVKSNSHIDYVCQIYNPLEVDKPPEPNAYALGQFVFIGLDANIWLVGVVYNTQILNPEFGRLGPRLSSADQVTVFSPDYLNEQAVLAGIVVVGLYDTQSGYQQGVPRLSVRSNAPVRLMSDENVAEFHQVNGRVRVQYASQIARLGTTTVDILLQIIMRNLMALFPDEEKTLTVLMDQLKWQSQIGAMRGD